MAGDQFPQLQLVSSDRRGPDVADGGLRVLVVGRRPGCEIVLPHVSISEIHACLVRRADGLWLYDLESRNGTRVGHARVKEKTLRHRDYVEFGSLRYEVRLTGRAAKSSHAPSPVSLRNTATGQIEHLGNVVSLVGRRSKCQLLLVGGEISHVHALLIRCPDGLLVHDLGSRTGTFVNGIPEREALLTGGEKLSFGRFEFEVRLENSAAFASQTAEEAFLAGPAPLTDSVVASIAVSTPDPFNPKQSRSAAELRSEKKMADEQLLPASSPWAEDSVLQAAINRNPADPPAAPAPEMNAAENEAVDQTLRFLSDKTDIMPRNVDQFDLGLSAVTPAAVNPSPLGEGGPLALSNVEGSGPGEGLRTETVIPLDPDHKLIDIPFTAPEPAAFNPSPLGEGGPSGPGEGLRLETAASLEPVTPQEEKLSSSTVAPATEQAALAPSTISDTISPADQTLSPMSAEVPDMKPPSSPQDPPPHVSILPTELRPARLGQADENSATAAAPMIPAPGEAPPMPLPSPEQLRLENEIETVRRHLAAERAAVAVQRTALDALLEERHRREKDEIAAHQEQLRREQEQIAAQEEARQALDVLRQSLQSECDAQAEAIKVLEAEQRKVDAIRDELQSFSRDLQDTRQSLAAEHQDLEAQRQTLADRRAELETQEQRLLDERRQVAEEKQVADQERASLEESRRELADRRQEFEAVKTEFDARLAAFSADSQRLLDDRQAAELLSRQVAEEAETLAADRQTVSQLRRQLDEDRAALAARQEQLAEEEARIWATAEEEARVWADAEEKLRLEAADVASRNAALETQIEEFRRSEQEATAARSLEAAAAADQKAALEAQIEEFRRSEQEVIAARNDLQQSGHENRAALEAEQQRLQAEQQRVADEQLKVEAQREELQALRRELQAAQQELAAERQALETQRQALADNRAALETEEQRLLAERQHVAAERQVADQDRARLEESRRQMAEHQQDIDAAKADLDARLAAFNSESQLLAADRETISQHRRQLDQERAALAARQDQLAAQHAETEKQTRRLGDLQADLNRRETALAASQAGAAERTAKLEKDLQQHAENVADFQRQAAQTESHRQAQLAEEEARVKDIAEKEARLKAAAVVATPAPARAEQVRGPAKSEPAKKWSDEVLRPETVPAAFALPLSIDDPTNFAIDEPTLALDQPTVALDPPSTIFGDTVQFLRAAVRGRLAQPQLPPKRRWLASSVAAAIVLLLVVAAVLILLHYSRSHNSAPPVGPLNAQAAASQLPSTTPSTVASRSDSATSAAVKTTPAAAAETAKPKIPGGVWPFKLPADLTNDKPADDLRATRSWAGNELGKNISALRKAYGLPADAGPRQAVALDLSPRLLATLHDFLPPPFAEESLSGGEPQHVTILVFLEFLYQGNSYLVVFKRIDQTGEVVLARRGAFTLYPGAIREHTIVLDPTRAPIPEPAQSN